MKTKKKKLSHHFPDDQFLAQNVVRTKNKKRSSSSLMWNMKTLGGGGVQSNYWGDTSPLDLHPCVQVKIPALHLKFLKLLLFAFLSRHFQQFGCQSQLAGSNKSRRRNLRAYILVSFLTQGYGLEFFYTAGLGLDSCSTKTESSCVERPKLSQVRCIYPTLLQQLLIRLTG